MNCHKCGTPVSRDEFNKVGYEYSESIRDMGYCYSCSTAVVAEIENDGIDRDDLDQSLTLNNPPQDEGDR